MESHTAAAASLLDIYDEPKSNAKIVQKALIQGQFPPIVCVLYSDVCGKVVNNVRNCGFFNDPWSGCQLKEERPTWSGSWVVLLHT